MSGRAQGRMKLTISDVEISVDENGISFEGGRIETSQDARRMSRAFSGFARDVERAEEAQMRKALMRLADAQADKEVL
jgi:hypothetical protein